MEWRDHRTNPMWHQRVVPHLPRFPPGTGTKVTNDDAHAAHPAREESSSRHVRVEITVGDVKHRIRSGDDARSQHDTRSFLIEVCTSDYKHVFGMFGRLRPKLGLCKKRAARVGAAAPLGLAWFRTTADPHPRYRRPDGLRVVATRARANTAAGVADAPSRVGGCAGWH